MRIGAGWVAGLLLAASCFSEHTGPSTGGEGITVGNVFFQSNRNGSSNPAADNVAVNTPLEWTWVNTASVSHSVRSTGSPSFVSSAIMTGNGTTYSISFPTPGVYRYDCEVHGSAMTGTVVVE